MVNSSSDQLILFREDVLPAGGGVVCVYGAVLGISGCDGGERSVGRVSLPYLTRTASA